MGVLVTFVEAFLVRDQHFLGFSKLFILPRYSLPTESDCHHCGAIYKFSFVARYSEVQTTISYLRNIGNIY